MHGRSPALSHTRRTDCVSAAVSPFVRPSESLYEVSVRGLGRALRSLVTHRATRTQGAAAKEAGEDGVAESRHYDVSCAALVHSYPSPRVPATPAPGRSTLPSSVPYDASTGVRCI